MELVISIILGIALAAAVGFRIFVPFLIMSIAAKSGYWELSDGFAWMASTPALVLFATATVLEIAAYYIPFFDNLLDVIAAPAAVLAGALLMASGIVDLDPLLKWVFAIVAGGGTAAIVKGTTTTARATSTVTTAGIANPVVATAETGSAIAIPILVVFLQALAAISVVLVFGYVVWRFLRRKKPRPPVMQ